MARAQRDASSADVSPGPLLTIYIYGRIEVRLTTSKACAELQNWLVPVACPIADLACL